MDNKMSKEAKKLNDLYFARKGDYVKRSEDEQFLNEINDTLAQKEISQYRDLEIEYPFIFVFGLPRSGTTLITQLIAYNLDVGYINNFMARFYKAPIHGIRLSRLIYSENKHTTFKSDYARTSEVTDIHEFGYFWRYWLKKGSFEGVTRSSEIEKDIDWIGLRKVLANIQNEFKKPMVFKNIFGSYHLQKLNEILGKVIFIYIKRDVLDSAVSILDARRKYYSDPNTWWSYMPVEYEHIRDLDYWNQIAGQVYFLRRYYNSEIGKNNLENVIHVQYEDLTYNPRKTIQKICEFSSKHYHVQIRQTNKVPEKFPFRQYNDRVDDKQRFQKLIASFEADNE
jgi:LPS sulfotransferase NodH